MFEPPGSVPGWQLVIQLGSEQPLTGHLYHVSNAPEHKTSCVGVARPPHPRLRGGAVRCGQGRPLSRAVCSLRMRRTSQARGRQGELDRGSSASRHRGESGGERCEIHRGSCALVGS